MRKLCLALALLIASTVAHAQPAYVSSGIGSFGAGVSSVAASFGSLPTSGNAIFAVLTYQDTTFGPTYGCSGVADNQGSAAFTHVLNSPASGSGGIVDIWELPSVGTTSGTYTATCTANSALSLSGILTIVQVSGIGVLDQSGTPSIGSVATITATATGPNTASTDFELSAVAIAYDAGSVTSIPSGFTSITNTYSTTGQRGLTVAYKVASIIETATSTWTWTNASETGAAIVSFLPASSFTAHPVTSNGHALISNGHPVL